LIGNCISNCKIIVFGKVEDEAEVLDVHSKEAVIYKNNEQTVHENVKFSDGDAGFSYDLDDYADPTRMMQDSDDADLGNFFNRPLKIEEFNWGLNVVFTDDFNPWALYFNNTRVKNRIANFNLLRCKLHLKFLVNGTPFHYGRIMVGYNPLDSFDETSGFAGLISQDLVQLSQRPHIFINPTTSEGGDMELPFFWHKNYLSIPNEEWDQMGKIFFRTINNLRHANGGDTPVTISVFAWATDVSLSIPTSVEPTTLQPQAKDQNIASKGSSKPKATMKAKSKPKTSMSSSDEHKEANKSGMISGPATAIAKAAGALKMIPMLTPYATAAEFAAEKTAAIAKLFGYSRPAVTKDPEPFKPVGNSPLALTTVPDMVNKLTVDDQQALTIDTRIAGVGSEDTLAIKGIAGRECYLTSFFWDTGDNPESLLWNARVNPCLWAESGSGDASAYHFPPCCMVAMPFKYWTGSMKFRFQVVRSAYHKGRIKVVYDPNFFASNEYNTNYLEVIDISEKDDFTITVGNGQGKTLLEHLDPGLDGESEGYSTNLYTADNKGNGVLGMYVVNKLTTPDELNGGTISINVYISMGDDFEVFVPEHKFMDFTPFPRLDLQSTDSPIPPSEDTEQGNAPLADSEDCEIGPTLQYEDMINRVWTGEAIHSLRPLLRRYFLWTAIGNADSSDTVLYGRFPSFPLYRGYDPNGVFETNDAPPFKYNFVNTGLVHWVTLAHQGWRGGLRYKFLQRGQFDYATLYLQRDTIGSGPNWVLTSTGPANHSNAGRIAADVVKDNSFSGNDTTAGFLGWQGQVYQNDKINPGLEFESPFYHDYRFYPGKTLDYTSSGSKIEGFDWRIFSDTSSSAVYDVHCACAEDFQVFFWTGLPRMYREAAPPAAL